MGAWGPGSFENDDALDWLTEYCDSPDNSMIAAALSAVGEKEADEYLEAPESSVGIGAAEVVAALQGAPGPGLSEDAKELISNLKTPADPSLVSLALKAVERIMTDSELKELWDESGNRAGWYEALNNLEARLRQ